MRVRSVPANNPQALSGVDPIAKPDRGSHARKNTAAEAEANAVSDRPCPGFSWAYACPGAPSSVSSAANPS